jgi:hypothetical protein
MAVTIGLCDRFLFALKLFESKVLRGIFTPSRVEVIEYGDNYIKRSFIICALHQILLV